MVDVSSARIGQHDYFQAIQEQLDHGGGYEALLHHLLHEVDVSQFEVRNVPNTAALRSQMAESLTGVEAAWFECLCRGELPGHVDKDGTAWLRGSDFVRWAANQGRHDWK